MIANLTLLSVFPDHNSSSNTQVAMKWCTNLEGHRRGALLFFNVIHQISRSHRLRNHQFDPDLGVFRWYLQFKFTDGYEIMHKALRGIEKVPLSFSRWMTLKNPNSRSHKTNNFQSGLDFCVHSQGQWASHNYRNPQTCLVNLENTLEVIHQEGCSGVKE